VNGGLLERYIKRCYPIPLIVKLRIEPAAKSENDVLVKLLIPQNIDHFRGMNLIC
jgi:hypothetical protein